MTGGDTPRLSVVLPTYNEADNIVLLVRRVVAALEGIPHELLVMDDRSSDSTAETALQVSESLPQLRVFEREPPPGLACSIRNGVEHARARHVVWMDCDLSHPPELVADMLCHLEEGSADLVVASRYTDGGTDTRRSGFNRAYSRVINGLCRLAISSRVHDYTTGYVMGSRDTILKLGLRGDYREYCIELLGRAALRGLKVLEVGYDMTDRKAGESKTLPDLTTFVARGLRYLATVARMFGERLRGPAAAGS